MAVKIRRTYKGAAVSALLDSAGVTSATQKSISLTTSPSTWPTGKFFVVVAPGTAQEEKMCVTLSGSTLTVVDPSVISTSESANGRGIDNTTARSAIAGGSAVYPVFTALDADEANELTSTYSAQGHMVYQGGSTFSGLAIGTAGQVLKVNSGATAPEWGQVGTAGIADGSVTEDKLATNAVTTGKIANGAILNEDINASAAIALTKLGTGALPTSITVASANIVDGTITKDDLATALQNLLVPVGSISMYSGAVAPAGWLLCDGTSTTGYPQLAALVGSTTPDMRGRFPIGDSNSLTLLANGGSATIATTNLPSHSHANTAVLTDGTVTVVSGGSHTHTFTTDGAGGHAHYAYGRQGATASHGHDGSDKFAMAPTNRTSTDYSQVTSGQSDHQHTGTTASGGSHSHSASVGTAITMTNANTGGGQDYYQPYTVVNFIIKHD